MTGGAGFNLDDDGQRPPRPPWWLTGLELVGLVAVVAALWWSVS